MLAGEHLTMGKAALLMSRQAAMHRAAQERYRARAGLSMICHVEVGGAELDLLARLKFIPDTKTGDRREVGRAVVALLRALDRRGGGL